MAAESVGLAASVAGIVSLGLQITGGIIKYVDAFESRQEEPGSVKQQSEVLNAILGVLDAHLNSHGQSVAVPDAVVQSMQIFRQELIHIQALHSDLVDSDPQTWTSRMKNAKKKVTYAFHRSRIQELGLRLQKAGDTLQLSLNVLGLKVLGQNTNTLAAVESSSQDISSGLSLVRSKLAAVEMPIVKINDELRLLRGEVDSKSQLAVSQYDNLLYHVQGSRNDVLRSVQETTDHWTQLQSTHNLEMAKRYEEMMNNMTTMTKDFGQMLKHLQQSGAQVPVHEAVVRGLAGKPALLKKLSDDVHVSFAMTSGAGGFSISPNFTLSPTVDDSLDPAFRILSLIDEGLLNLDENPEHFMKACITRLCRLLDDKKVCATAVNSLNMGLMHYAISAVDLGHPGYYGEQGPGVVCSLFVELVRMLLSYGAPAFAIDLDGMSPLIGLKSWLFEYDMSLAVTDVLIQANLEDQPLVLGMAHTVSGYDDLKNPTPAITIGSLYKVSLGFAEVSGCGPLSMEIIEDDADRVKHILDRTPGSIAEIDVFGQSPFHLAAAKPSILETLMRYGDGSSLDRRDMSGFTALEIAMIHTSDCCDNGNDTDRCDANECGCCQCLDLFIGANCDVRMHELKESGFAPGLEIFLPLASELARQKYVSYMKRQRNSTIQHPSPSPCPSTKSKAIESNTNFKTIQVEMHTTIPSQQPESSSAPGMADDMSWVFSEIDDPHLGALFYRHGFQPHPSTFNHLRLHLNYPYFHWLELHGVDPAFRLSIGPTFREDHPNIGLFGAHFAFYRMGLWLKSAPDYGNTMPGPDSWNICMDLATKVYRQNLTDGRKCHCTIYGCTPFTWMMKGSHLVLRQWIEPTRIPEVDINKFVSYYRRCGIELTSLTYKAAIRYATFQALGLIHTCCDTWSLVHDDGEWIDREDVDIFNEEQASLLDMLEVLVEEFEETAVEFMKTDSSGNSLFPRFWTICWKVRMEKELKKLNGEKLTHAEKRGAEEIGVWWTQPPQETEKGNPFSEEDPKHWFHELDKICPEYVEPWPEEICRVSKLP